MAQALGPVLDVASFAMPQYAAQLVIARGFSGVVTEMVNSAREGTKSSRGKNSYVAIGNYHFIGGGHTFALDHKEEDKINRCLEMSVDSATLTQTAADIPVYHAVENYTDFVAEWSEMAGTFPAMVDVPRAFQGEIVLEMVPRRVELRSKYLPEITSAELVRVQSHDRDILRLRLTGYHLFNHVLELCSFDFGFPFGNKEDNVIVKRMALGTDVERVIIEEDYVNAPNISDHGTLIRFATQFGQCEHIIRRSQIRNLHIPSISQISNHDSISVLLKRAIQRGMAISQIRRESGKGDWKAADEKIVQEILRLASITLTNKDQFEELCATFQDTNKHVQFILSNEGEFAKIQDCCEIMQNYVRAPLKITASKTVVKKIGIGVATLVGGAILAYIAGPGLVVIGAIEAMSVPAVSVAGAVGGLGAGYVTDHILTNKMADESYEQVLTWVIRELYKKFEKNEDPKEDIDQEEDERKKKLLQDVSDLREDGSVYSLEKALLLMFNPDVGVDNFRGCDLEFCTDDSKRSVIKRMECIKAIHGIREPFSDFFQSQFNNYFARKKVHLLICTFVK